MKQWTSLQQKAVAWYAQLKNAQLALSAWPTIYYRSRSDGSEFNANVFDIVTQYKAQRESERKEAARAKRQAAKK